MKNNKRHGKKGPNQIFHYSPVENTTLLPFLYVILAPKSKSDIKSMLAHNHIAVNGQPLSLYMLSPKQIAIDYVTLVAYNYIQTKKE